MPEIEEQVLPPEAENPAAEQAPAPAAADPEPSAPPTAAPDAGTGEPEEGSVDQEPAPQPAPSKGQEAKPDWRDKKLARLTAKLREYEAQQAQPPSEQAQAPAGEDEVNRRAAEMVAQQTFVQKCNDAVAQGRASEEFGQDFDARIAGLKQVVNGTDAGEVAAYNKLLEAVLESGEAPRLLYEIGGDLDKASELLQLAGASPVRLGIEIAKMSLKQGTPAPSKAPKPITPVGAKGAQHTAIDPKDPERADRLDTKTWIARRQAEVDNRRKAGERIY